MEPWIDIAGYDGLYKINEDGDIMSLDRVRTGSHFTVRHRVYKSRILKPGRAGRYNTVVLTKMGIKKTLLVHRLVALTFIPNPENKKYVNHLDFNRFNNKASNLEWCSQLENVRYTVSAGRNNAPKGEKNSMSKFNDAEIIKLFELRRGGKTQAEIAKMFSVDPSTVSTILTRKTYRHVDITGSR